MFYGREDLLRQLTALLARPGASLVTCRGRRRIGKSTLIEEFARRNNVRFIKLEGLPPSASGNNTKQLAAFIRQLSRQTGSPRLPVATWFDAFSRLDDTLGEERTVVFLDEISWMGKYDGDFPGELKYAWDNRFKKHDKLVMVICGSVSTWITKNILRSKGFVGRPALNLVVTELPPSDCRAFWRRKADKLAATELFDVLSVTGGIPKYLEMIDPKLDAAANIRNLCFTQGGLLRDEFTDIFSDIFEGKHTLKRRILDLLATGPKGTKEISEELDTQNNGHLSDNLEELEIAGFIAKDGGINPLTGEANRLVRYRIADNYTRFYLKCIAPRTELIDKGLFRFDSLEQLPGWDVLMGLQFECLILNNIKEIVPRLGISPTALISAAPYRRRDHSRGKGCQIDLLLQTHKSLWIVEIKRKHEIGAEVIDEVAEKVKKLGIGKGISVRTALVYCGHLSPAVEAEGFFDGLINAEDLLK